MRSSPARGSGSRTSDRIRGRPTASRTIACTRTRVARRSAGRQTAAALRKSEGAPKPRTRHEGEHGAIAGSWEPVLRRRRHVSDHESRPDESTPGEPTYGEPAPGEPTEPLPGDPTPAAAAWTWPSPEAAHQTGPVED